MQHTAIPTDEDLMDEVRKDQLDSMRILFERYHQRLYQYFLYLSGQPDLSQDLTQNVFYRIMRYRNSYRSGASFRTWMYQIARNVQNDHYQKSKMKFSDYEQIEGKEDESGSALKHLEKQEMENTLEEAMKLLPDAQREIILLSRYEGMRYREIGEVLGCSEGAVKVRVHRAMQQLKEVFFKLA